MEHPPYIVVILHGFNGSPRKMAAVAELAKECYPGAKLIIPSTRISYLSTIDLNTIAHRLLLQIDKAWNEINNEACRIILIGHSLGGLFARKIYVLAWGEREDAPFEAIYTDKTRRKWAPNIERIVLLAGMNNGWHFDFHARPLVYAMVTLAAPLGNLFALLGRHLSVYQVRRGGTFITQLKLQTIAMYDAKAGRNIGNAMIVQLLGTKDNLVSPEDNIDLVSMGDFYYVEAPSSDHQNVIDINSNKRRKTAVTTALTATREQLTEQQICTAELPKIVPNTEVSDVIFVIHGIRDDGYWTKKIANRVVSIGRSIKGKKFETETSSYGYFPMLYFTLPSTRRDKVHWLMDQYAENKLRFPSARFSYVGHSNGTYLLAKSLEKYPACKFHNILLAGSVVNESYDWEKLKAEGRISRIYNVAATSDWVVGIFPHALGIIGFRELGAGGYWGFNKLANNEQIITIPGGHSAGIEEERWDDIARFIVDDDYVPRFSVDVKKRFISFTPLLAVIIFFVALGAMIWGGYAILDSEWPKKELWFIVYLFVLWKVLTRF